MKDYKKQITETASHYHQLEKASIEEIVRNINYEDSKVHHAVKEKLHDITYLIQQIVPKFKKKGRVFYIGSGTSGRLAVVDAAECLPTFGISNKIIGIIAGGIPAFTRPVEFAEDDKKQAWKDIEVFSPCKEDVLIGISASGNTPYVAGAVKEAKKNKLYTACITCNENTLLSELVDCPIEVIVGAEFITGSTRMKAGTAQKMILNIISTTLMIQLNRVEDNKMVHMQLSNKKLLNRGIEMLKDKLQITTELAREELLKYKSVKKILELYEDKK